MNYLVDIATLKHYSYIDSDVNDETLNVTLKRVQDIYLEPALGTTLYKRLLQGVENDDLTALEVALMVYVLDFVYVGCELKASNHNNWKIRNKNVGVASDEHTRANSVSDYNNYVDELRKDLSFYKNRLIGYLKDNRSSYPQYICTTKKEDINPENQGTNYTSKISFL